MPKSTRLRTIGDFIAHGMELSFHCDGPGCVGRLRKIDLQKLGDALGFDWDLYWPKQRETAKPLPVKCAVCGGKPVGFILHSPAPKARGVP